MATNFRLSYNNGYNVIDLFPQSNMQAVANIGNILNTSMVEVTIPPLGQELTREQNITLSLTPQQQSAPFFVVLKSTGEQALRDYSTIVQMYINGNTLTILRFDWWPSGSIDVQLFFEENQAV